MSTTMRPIRPENTEGVTNLYSGTLLFLGIALTVLGVVAIISSVLFTIGTVLVLGGLLVAAGIVECMQAFKFARQHKRQVSLNVLSALIYLSAGGIMLWSPVAGALSLTLIISAFLLFNGVINISHGLTRRREPQWGWFIFGGLIDLALGALIALGWPVTGLWIIGLFVGIELVIYGAAWIAMSVGFKRIEKDLSHLLT